MTTVTWPGRSRREYTFELHPIGTNFLDLPGVYVFCRPSSPGFMEALYVGETDSFQDRLHTRLVDHDGYKRACRAQASHVAVMRVGNPTQRLWIETDLRHGLDPVCNLQGTKSLLGSV